MSTKRIRVAAIAIASLFVLYVLFGFFAAPILLKRQLLGHVDQKLNHQLSLAAVRVNPLTLAIEIDDFDLREPSGAALLAFKRLRVDFEASSLFRRAWTFAEISLDAPAVIVEIRKDGAFNFSPLLAALRDPEPKPQTTLPRINIHRIKFSAGDVSLADLQAGAQARLKITPINFELTELSTLPGESAPYKLTARTTDGESVAWTGDISLNPIASSGSLALSGWKIATLTKLLGDRIAIDKGAGQLEIALGYRASYDKGTPAFAIANGEIRIADMALSTAGAAEPLVQLRTIALTGITFDLAGRAASATRFEIAKGRLALGVDPNGAPNWTALIAARPNQAPSPPAAAGDAAPPAAATDANQAPWRIKVAAADISDLDIKYADRRADRQLELAAARAGLSLPVTIEHGADSTRIEIPAVKLNVAALTLNGSDQRVTSGPLDIDVAGIKSALSKSTQLVDVGATKINLGALKARSGTNELGWDRTIVATQSLQANLRAETNAPPQITLQGASIETAGFTGRTASAKADVLGLKSLALSAGTATVALGGDPLAARIDAIAANLAGLVIRDPRAGAELARVGRIELAGGSARTAERVASIDRIAVSDGFGAASLGADGKLNWDTLLAAFRDPKAKAPPARTQSKVAATDAWKALIKSFELRNFGAALADQRASPAIALTLQAVNARVQNVSTDAKQSALLDLSGHIKEGGQFSAAGQLNLQTFATDMKVKVSEVSLTPAQAFLAPLARLQIVSAVSSLNGRVRYGEAKTAGAALVFEGELDLTKLQIDETEPAQPFLALDALKASQVRLALTPNRLEIPELRVSGLATKLLIAEDQSVNITKVMRPKTGNPAADTAGAVTPAPAAASAGLEEPFPISVSRIRIDNSRLEFSDLSLRPQFATRMHELKGVVTGISTARDSRAQIELDARVDEFGAARIRGDINLFQPRVYTDVGMVFRNLEMTALTPYSAKFAGYRIASGKLSMDLQYRVKNSALVGENKIVLDKLELGERVDSPGALSLPLELAIAILKDSDGRIDIGLPVSGSLDDPQFSYGALIWKAIGNLLTRIVTAPFRALAGLFGGGSEKLDAIEFDAGDDRLQPPERQKLRTVADALAKRPQLKLTIKPIYAPGTDRPMLQATGVRKEVHTRSGIKLAAGEAPGPIDFNNSRSQQAILAIFEEKFGAPAVRDLRARLVKAQSVASAQGEKPPSKPAALPPDRLYRVMTEQLTADYPVTDTELRELASRRAAMIVKELVEAGKIEPSRVTTTAAQDNNGDATKTVTFSLELGAAK